MVRTISSLLLVIQEWYIRRSTNFKSRLYTLPLRSLLTVVASVCTVGADIFFGWFDPVALLAIYISACLWLFIISLLLACVLTASIYGFK